MRKIISLSALALLVAGCAAKTAPVEPAADAEAAPPAAEPAAVETPAAPASSVTAATDLKWMAANPEHPDGPKMALVEGNPKEGAFTALAKFPAGHASPIHSHPAGFAGVTISGTVQNGRSADDNVSIGAGSLWTQPANEAHYTGCTESADCLFVAHMDGAMATTPAEAPVEGVTSLMWTF